MLMIVLKLTDLYTCNGNSAESVCSDFEWIEIEWVKIEENKFYKQDVE